MMTEIILLMNGYVTKSYRKLMYGQINDTKHTKTRWTVIYIYIYIYIFILRVALYVEKLYLLTCFRIELEIWRVTVFCFVL